MPKDKLGNQLTWKEYMERWKKGIKNITPFQEVKIQIRSTWITLIGIIGGIIISLFSIKTLWWLLLILIGALGNTTIQQLSLYQKKRILDSLLNIGEKEVNENV